LVPDSGLGPLTKVAEHLKAGTPVIVEGKIKPETYTQTAGTQDFLDQGRLHPQDQLTKLEEDGAGAAAKSARKRK